MDLRPHVNVKWTEWMIGFWYWPIEKDRGFGLSLGPVHLTWSRALRRALSVQSQRNPKGDTDGDDDSREENSSGDTEDGV